jgi:hypothetical protein
MSELGGKDNWLVLLWIIEGEPVLYPSEMNSAPEITGSMKQRGIILFRGPGDEIPRQRF